MLEALKRLSALGTFVDVIAIEEPGPGWVAVADMLICDREALERELRDREQP